MSSKNNVNPDHYKTAGRERQGEDIIHEVYKRQYTQSNRRTTSLPPLGPTKLHPIVTARATDKARRSGRNTLVGE